MLYLLGFTAKTHKKMFFFSFAVAWWHWFCFPGHVLAPKQGLFLLCPVWPVVDARGAVPLRAAVFSQCSVYFTGRGPYLAKTLLLTKELNDNWGYMNSTLFLASLGAGTGWQCR